MSRARERLGPAAYAGQVSEEFRLQQVPYEHPDVAALERAAQQFYVQIYGGPDETPFTTADFSASSWSVLRRLPGRSKPWPWAVGDFELLECRGWRSGQPRSGGCSYAKTYEDAGSPALVLAALEASAAAAGADWMLLETGQPQVAAVGLYRSSGYVDVERFGHYAASELALNLGRRLP